jgi:hypothetical protein
MPVEVKRYDRRAASDVRWRGCRVNRHVPRDRGQRGSQGDGPILGEPYEDRTSHRGGISQSDGGTEGARPGVCEVSDDECLRERRRAGGGPLRQGQPGRNSNRCRNSRDQASRTGDSRHETPRLINPHIYESSLQGARKYHLKSLLSFLAAR